MPASPNATIIDVHKTAMQLTELLSCARAGSEIIIADGDKWLARVVPIPPEVPRELASRVPGPRVPGLGRGSVWVSDDFDDELPDEIWFGDDTTS